MQGKIEWIIKVFYSVRAPSRRISLNSSGDPRGCNEAQVQTKNVWRQRQVQPVTLILSFSILFIFMHPHI